MNILIATDLTSGSDAAVSRGLAMARQLDGIVELVHVLDEEREDTGAAARKAAADKLRLVVDRFEASGRVSTRLHVVSGRPGEEIVRLVESGSLDLVIVGPPAADGRRSSRSIRRTTAGTVISATLKPVLVARHLGGEYRRTLVGVDFSVFALSAVRQAATIAPTSELNLVHAYQVPYPAFAGARASRGQLDQERRIELDRLLDTEMSELKDRTRDLAQPVFSHVREGAPTEVLRACCRELEADLLVIGTHSRPDFSRMIWGSVADDLLADSPCDLLVVVPSLEPGHARAG